MVVARNHGLKRGQSTARRLDRLPVLAALAMALGVGCGDVDTDGVAGPCGAEHGLVDAVPCDVREDDCQRRIFEAVRCVRGGETQMPPVRVLSLEAYEEEVRGERAGQEDGQEESEPASDPWSRAVSLLGLLPEQTDLVDQRADDSVAYTAGFYSREYGDVTLVDRDGDLEGEWGVSLLVHEFTHALQDSGQGISELFERNSYLDDSEASLTALVEGEARLMEDRAYSILFDQPLPDRSLALAYEWQLSATRRSVVSGPAPYTAIRRLLYPLGAAYLREVAQQQGYGAVLELWQSPPPSSVRWMVGPQREADYQGRWEQLFDCQPAMAPQDWRWQYSNILGALMLYAFLSVHDGDPLLSVGPAWETAIEWRGDRLHTYVDDQAGMALMWQVRMESQASAHGVLEAMARLPHPHRTFLDGSEVTLLLSSTPEPMDAWAGARRCERETRPSDPDPSQ